MLHPYYIQNKSFIKKNNSLLGGDYKDRIKLVYSIFINTSPFSTVSPSLM